MKRISRMLALVSAVVTAQAGCGGRAPAQALPDDTDQIQRLTVKHAEQLATRDVFLSFDRLTQIDPDVAAALATHNGVLLLNGLTEISEDVVDALSENTRPIYLNGVRTL